MSEQDPTSDAESSSSNDPPSEGPHGGGSQASAAAGRASEPESTGDGAGAPAGSAEEPAPTTDAGSALGVRESETVLFESTPTIKPTLIVAGVTILVGLGVEGYLVSNPELVGGPETTEILLYVIAFVLAVALLRFLVRMLVLERTTYQITDEVVRREYNLLYRQLSREVPIEQLRAHELRKNRIQSILGYGTVRFLTGGTNESLGFVEFENLIEPYEVQDVTRDIIR